MVYVDTTLTGEVTYVNCRQVYDVVAGAMTTHPAWDYIEFKDAISGGTTYRRHVWRCTAAQSGLSADYFVVFELQFTTAGTVWNPTAAVRVYLGETYSAGVLGKFATIGTSTVTLASDLTNPATFTLTTFTVPTTIWNGSNGFGSTSQVTSLRFYGLVAKDAMILSRALDGFQSANNSLYNIYIGAYESILGAVADPLPLMVMGTNMNNTNGPAGGATRAPTFTPATSYTDVFGVSNTTASSTHQLGNATGWVLGSGGRLMTSGTAGLASDLAWFKNMGGPIASRCLVLSPVSTSLQSTRGLFRGYTKYLYGLPLATHLFGDTFLVDGKVMVGSSNTSQAIIDTTAV